jgi:threonine/homoserine/homoserine lactone efflux protein
MFPFIEGILLGLTLAVILGPAFFTLLQTSIYRGVKAGMLIASGIVLSDLAIVMLSYFGVTQLLMNQRNHLFLGLASGIILIAFGLVTYKRRACDFGNSNGNQEKPPSLATYLLKGFFLNFANPFIWVFWISLMVGISANYDQSKPMILTFFAGALLAIYGTDLAKVMIANRIKRFLTEGLMAWVNRIVGVVLCSFGTILILRVFISI